MLQNSVVWCKGGGFCFCAAKGSDVPKQVALLDHGLRQVGQGDEAPNSEWMVRTLPGVGAAGGNGGGGLRVFVWATLHKGFDLSGG